MTKVFNEETLLIEIEKVWGCAGAHAEVYKNLLSRLKELEQKCEQADVSGSAALIAQNKKLNKELEIVHDCLTDLYNDQENRIGNRVRKCLDKIEKHCR